MPQQLKLFSSCSRPAGAGRRHRGVAGRAVDREALALADPVYAPARGSIVPEAKTGEADLPRRLEHAYLASASHRR
jgi:hypothetical protein